MTEAPAGRRRLGSPAVLLAGVGQAALAGAVMAALLGLRALMLDHAFNPRLMASLGVLAGSAALAAFLVSLALPRRLGLRPWVAIPALAVVLAGMSMIMAGLIYSVIVVDLMALESPFEDPDFNLQEYAAKHGIAAYVMLVAAWDLIFPWVLPAQSLVSAAAMARFARPGQTAG